MNRNYKIKSRVTVFTNWVLDTQTHNMREQTKFIEDKQP